MGLIRKSSISRFLIIVALVALTALLAFTNQNHGWMVIGASVPAVIVYALTLSHKARSGWWKGFVVVSAAACFLVALYALVVMVGVEIAKPGTLSHYVFWLWLPLEVYPYWLGGVWLVAVDEEKHRTIVGV